MNAGLRVVFAGTPANAAETLSFLHSNGVSILGVVTRKDVSIGRQRMLTPSPVAVVASKLGLPVYKSNSIDDAAISWIRALGPDVGVVVAYGSIFTKSALEVPRLGWVNVHYSLLPDLPGPAPVQHCLLQGRKGTGVTVFRLDEGIDTGPIIEQSQVPIFESDNAGSLLSRLTDEGSELLSRILHDGEVAITRAVGQEGKEGVYAGKPTRSMSQLDFQQDASEQINKVRAMNPEPMAWFDFNGSPIRVLRARLTNCPVESAGTARLVDKDLVVDCSGGSMILDTIQPAGKKEMLGADWFRGLHVDELKLS